MIAFLGDGGPQGLAGWIVVPNGTDQLVRFVRKVDGQFVPGWDVPVQDGRAGEVKVAAGVLTPVETGMFDARQTAIDNLGTLRCSRSMNSVVLKDPDGDGWLVWLLTSTTQDGIVPVGGHYRFRISADGQTVTRRDQLSTGCMNLNRTQTGPQGQTAA
ncbi:MAG: cellulose binding, type IV, partial [bacterium]